MEDVAADGAVGRRPCGRFLFAGPIEIEQPFARDPCRVQPWHTHPYLFRTEVVDDGDPFQIRIRGVRNQISPPRLDIESEIPIRGSVENEHPLSRRMKHPVLDRIHASGSERSCLSTSRWPDLEIERGLPDDQKDLGSPENE